VRRQLAGEHAAGNESGGDQGGGGSPTASGGFGPRFQVVVHEVVLLVPGRGGPRTGETDHLDWDVPAVRLAVA
jgi:hypothetical protein